MRAVNLKAKRGRSKNYSHRSSASVINKCKRQTREDISKFFIHIVVITIHSRLDTRSIVKHINKDRDFFLV